MAPPKSAQREPKSALSPPFGTISERHFGPFSYPEIGAFSGPCFEHRPWSLWDHFGSVLGAQNAGVPIQWARSEVNERKHEFDDSCTDSDDFPTWKKEKRS